jgi:hypothetical protein
MCTVTCAEKLERCIILREDCTYLQGKGITTCAPYDDVSVEVSDGNNEVIIFDGIKALVNHHIVSSTE